jgi:hypothetical protein
MPSSLAIAGGMLAVVSVSMLTMMVQYAIAAPARGLRAPKRRSGGAILTARGVGASSRMIRTHNTPALHRSRRR